MSQTFEHIVDIVAAVIIIFLFPLIYFGQKQDALIQTLVSVETDALVSEIQSSGSLTSERYNLYQEDLAMTGMLYDVLIMQKHTVYEPEYRLRTEQEVIDAQNSAYTGMNNYIYTNVITDIPTVTDPIYNETLNTETNASVLASAFNNPKSDSHAHSDDCYTGHRHTGSVTYTTTHQHDWNCNVYASTYLTYVTCYNCSKQYLKNQDYYYWNPVNNMAVFIGGYTYQQCSYCGYTSGGYNHISYTNYQYSCGYDKDMNGDGFCDNVGTTTAYTYTLSAPPLRYYRYASIYDGSIQLAAVGSTVQNGCYTFHRHGNIPGYFTNINHYSSAGILRDINNIGGAANTCKIPETWEFRLYHTSNGDMYKTIRYRTEIQTDGTVLFKFLTCFGFDNSTWCPTYLTWNQFSNAFQDGNGFKNFCQTYYKADFLYNISSSDLITYNTVSGTVDNCRYTEGWNPTCGQIQNTNPSCNQLVASITPTHPIQIVAIGDPLITTVTATFKDGSTKVVAALSIYSTAGVAQNQNVTLNYSYLLEGTTFTKNCTIVVTVIPRNKTCINGHKYNLKADGTDAGCPYCKAWLSSLIITYPSSGALTVYKGTTLPDNGVSLLATYMDGRTEILFNEYVDNLDENFVGLQNVTISYKGKYVNLSVITKRVLKKCPECNRYYELHPDMSDPGCPFCLARTPLFTGNIMEYNIEYITEDVLTELYEGNGVYYFSVNDYIAIQVSNSRKSWGRRLLEYFFHGMSDHGIQIINSGNIRETGDID